MLMLRVPAVAKTAVAALLAGGMGVLLVACGAGPVADGPGGGATTVPVGTPAGESACTDTPTGGNSTVMVDWVDFVRLAGVEYVAGQSGSEGVVPPERVGPLVGRVECRLSVLAFTEPPPPAVDGDAAFLPVGTQVHAVVGSAPACRVTARVDGVYRIYVAQQGAAGRSTAVACPSGS